MRDVFVADIATQTEGNRKAPQRTPGLLQPWVPCSAVSPPHEGANKIGDVEAFFCMLGEIKGGGYRVLSVVRALRRQAVEIIYVILFRKANLKHLVGAPPKHPSLGRLACEETLAAADVLKLGQPFLAQIRLA